MTHNCPTCKFTHNIWYHIEGKNWHCGKCGYVLNLMKEEIEKLLPEKKNCPVKYPDTLGFRNGVNFGHDSARSDIADRLTKRVATIEDVKNSIGNEVDAWVYGKDCDMDKLIEALQREFIFLKKG